MTDKDNVQILSDEEVERCPHEDGCFGSWGFCEHYRGILWDGERVMLSAYNFDELGVPENYGDSPKFGGWLCSGPGDPNGAAAEDDAGQSQAPNELEMVKIHLVTKEVEEFLTVLHALLVKRRYAYLRGALLLALWAELESQIAEKRIVELESIKEAFSVFLTLDNQEVQEMAGLAYLAGCQAKIVDDIPLQEQAESFVEVLGLQELMEFNMSLGEEVKGTTE